MNKMQIIAASSEVQQITEEGRRIKAELLEEAALVPGTIKDETVRDGALVIAREIKGHLNKVEASRKEVKEPFLRISQQIDALAKEHVKELNEVLTRINRSIGDFEAELQAKLRKEEEERRKAYEAAELERIRLEREQAEKAKKPVSMEEALRIQEWTEEAERQVAQAMKDMQIAAVQTSVNKAAGGSLRKDWEIEVIDIHQVYASRPSCVKMELNLVEVKGLLDLGVKIQGINAKQINVFATRGAK